MIDHKEVLKMTKAKSSSERIRKNSAEAKSDRDKVEAWLQGAAGGDTVAGLAVACRMSEFVASWSLRALRQRGQVLLIGGIGKRNSLWCVPEHESTAVDAYAAILGPQQGWPPLAPPKPRGLHERQVASVWQLGDLARRGARAGIDDDRKRCVNCGRSGHSSNACPWRKVPLTTNTDRKHNARTFNTDRRNTPCT
jgi:hypothetical protein